MENQTKDTKSRPSIFRRLPLLPIAFLYLLGFFIVRKSNFDSSTALDIGMLIFGWLCIVGSLVLSISVLVSLFKAAFKKK
jgi:TRAP-type C4-dicarboxylate transport system permease small subunit